MNTEERKTLKATIISKIAATEKKLIALEDASQPISPENSIGRVSRMDAINNKGVSDAALRNAKKQLNSLQLALTKVDDPKFGACSNCKRPIQSARLMYMPGSTLCIRCAR
jgi:DnaK suppressor protein